MCLTKSECWGYEQEVRCFREISDQRLLVPFSPESLVRIILGPNMDFEVISRCIALKNERYPNAEVLLATPNPSKFSVDLTPLPPFEILDAVWNARYSINPLNPDGPTGTAWPK